MTAIGFACRLLRVAPARNTKICSSAPVVVHRLSLGSQLNVM